MANLKPCPFCGSGGNVQHRIERTGSAAWGCSICGARGPLASRDGSDAPLIDAWNRRVPDVAALDSFRAAALEDAARLCESVRDANYTATQSCAAAIRALKGTP